MNYYYRPVFISDWVNQEIKERKRLPFNTEKFKSILADLEIQTKRLLTESFARFQTWFERLGPEKILAFTFILPKLRDLRAIKLIEQKIITFSKKDIRVFDYALHSCYYHNEFNETWGIARGAYFERGETITLGWDVDKKRLWDALINDGRPIGSQIAMYAANIEFEKLFSYLMVEKSHLFYQELLLSMFSNGTTSLYKAYQNEFLDYFRKADIMKRQLLAEGFISSKSCYDVPKISGEIFNKLQTYITSPMKWDGVKKEEKVEFHSWYMSKELFDFFGSENEGGERFVYWKKYSRRIERLVNIPHDNTILMYFREVVIIERLDTGAIYVFERNSFDEKHGIQISNYEKVYRPGLYISHREQIFRSTFMDKESVYKDGWIAHTRGWQNRVDNFLRYKLGWDV